MCLCCVLVHASCRHEHTDPQAQKHPGHSCTLQPVHTVLGPRPQAVNHTVNWLSALIIYYDTRLERFSCAFIIRVIRTRTVTQCEPASRQTAHRHNEHIGTLYNKTHGHIITYDTRTPRQNFICTLCSRLSSVFLSAPEIRAQYRIVSTLTS